MAQINKPDTYFNTKLYTGNASTLSVTGVGFQPDWVWIKNRSIVADHKEFDAVRGVTNALITNSTSAEFSQSGLDSFDSDGFTVGSHVGCNGNGNSLVAWNWLASNTTASNSDGSITSTVSANTTSGFSIVSYTGNGTSGTIGHGLGSIPQMIIVKNRTDSAHEWKVYHHTLGNNKRLHLNDTSAVATTTAPWNATTPTSSVFSVGADGGTNDSGDSMIAYCFAEKKGFSKFGSYTGNGNADGPFVYTGMRPAFVLIKQSSAAGQNWFLTDNKRNEFNAVDKLLYADSSNAEVTSGSHPIDFLSNGFKCRGTGAGNNGSGATYIYMAFAENPLVGTNNIPATAR
jgi:hypothetical protein